MLIKDKLSRISLNSLIPSKKIPAPVVLTEEPLSSSPFVMPQNRKIDAPFTGRVKELDLLRSLYRELTSFRSNIGSSKNDLEKPLVIGIKGEAVIAKSRLVTEFQKNITASHHGKNFIYRAGCVSSGQEAYGLFRGFFSKSNFLKQAVTAERRTLIKNTISENILSLAREAGKNDLPLVIMLEDMQWADELSLAALDHFVSAVNLAAGEEDLMLFLLLNYRPSYRPGRVLRKECRLVEIELKGFSESESKQFISKLTGSKKITTNAVEQISRRSEGNPFNLEEICRSLDDGSKHIKIPATVKGLLVDKVSQLEKDERAVLIISSVLGRKFSLKLLNAILKKAGKPLARADALSRLEEKQYLVNLTSDIYEFRHDLLQEIVYRELRKDLRKNVHALAAAAIEEIYSANLSAHYYELTRHYEASGDDANTIKYLEKAGDKARDNYENERALNFYVRLLKKKDLQESSMIVFKIILVLQMLGRWNQAISTLKKYLNHKIDPRNLLLFVKYAEISFLKGDYDLSLSVYKRTLRNIKKSHDDTLICSIFGGMGRIYIKTSEFKKAHQCFDMQLQHATSSLNKLEIAKAHENIGVLKRLKGNYTSALIHYQTCSRIFSELRNQYFLAIVVDKIGTIYFYLGDTVNALRNYRYALEINRKINSVQAYQNTLGNIAIVYVAIGQFAEGKKILYKRLLLCKKLNEEQAIANTYFSLGSLSLQEKKLKKALSFYEKSRVMAEGLQNLQLLSKIISNIALVYQTSHQYLLAEKFLEQQIKIDKKIGNEEGLVRGYVNLGNNYSYSNRKNFAIISYKKAIRIVNKLDIIPFKATVLYNLAEVFTDIGNIKGALKIIKKLELVCHEDTALEEEKKMNELITRINGINQERKIQ